MIPIYVLSGEVTDESGTGLPDVNLQTFFEIPGGLGISSSTFSNDEPGSEGYYSMYLLPETYSLTINPPTGTRFAATTIDVSISGNSNLNIVLEEQLLLTGSISGIPSDPELDIKYGWIKAVKAICLDFP